MTVYSVRYYTTEQVTWHDDSYWAYSVTVYR